MVNMKITRWRPDTCNCTIEYEWDKDLPAADRVHTGTAIVKDCPDHAGITDPVQFYDVIADENSRKNKIWNQLIDPANFPDIAELDEQGNFTFKNGEVVTWHFTGVDDARVLNVDLSGTSLNQGQKNSAQNWADTNLGAGKVLII
jgi:hypothetical protein